MLMNLKVKIVANGYKNYIRQIKVKYLLSSRMNMYMGWLFLEDDGVILNLSSASGAFLVL
jgi:hypothetical protein